MGQGIGIYPTTSACAVALYSSVALYSTSKFFVYVFLVERVHVVWDPTRFKPRRKSPVYLACMAMVFAYMGVTGYVFTDLRFDISESECYMKIQREGAIAFMVVDVVLTIVLTSLFIWSLRKHAHSSPRLRRVAIRSATVVLITLPTSCINIVLLLLHHTIEHGWAFILCWELDLLINAFALFWVTSGSGVTPATSARHKRDLQTAHDMPSSSLRRMPSWISGWPQILEDFSDAETFRPTQSCVTEKEHVNTATIASVARAAQKHPHWHCLLPNHRLSGASWLTPDTEISGFFTGMQFSRAQDAPALQKPEEP
ncbi:hypothetical protein BC835DRAFT_327876 [Cytidiella melzeri]|nr:hypothetical protein BC835DRAFT_327876 [Cytidiella melzeri]